MGQNATVIASGNLATNRRTVTGVLGQFSLLNVEQEIALQLLLDAGLPARALDEPDFPISLNQELQICGALVDLLGTRRSPATTFMRSRGLMGIENLGVLGMAMRHADSALEALKVCLDFPQLSWGHSRMIVRREQDMTIFSFTMQRPQLRDASAGQLDRLVAYGETLDLVSSMRNIEDILDSREPPLFIRFPYPEPADWSKAADDLPCPVYFQADECCLAYAGNLQDQPLPRANTLVFRSFRVVAEKLSQMLAEEISLTERVSRWLWAYTPPLRRGEIARQLALSERSLTRQLGCENTSYAELLASVQSERARNFLRNPTLSIGEIGYRLGYSEPAAFTRAFTRWTGQSPKDWRCANREL